MGGMLNERLVSEFERKIYLPDEADSRVSFFHP